MSARAPIGATNRADLFTARADEPTGRREPPEEQNFQSPEEELEIQLQDAYGLGPAEDSPLKLEHMLGYSGDSLQTVLLSPVDENILIKSLGCLISIENLSDYRSQRLLRGHDMHITALGISPSGNLIASGQIGTRTVKGFSAPIFLWRVDIGRRVGVLKGVLERVNLVSFSTDERFLCGCGEDSLLYVWDLGSSEVVFAQRLPSPASAVTWIEHKPQGSYRSYELVASFGNTVNRGTFTYDPTRVQWHMKLQPFLFPPAGLTRSFTCAYTSDDRERSNIYMGTAGGEFLVLRREAGVFRGCIPVCSNGLNCLLVLPDGTLICGGGDGSVKRVRGDDMSWQVMSETTLEGRVLSLSLSPNLNEFIIGMSTGDVFRCLIADLSLILVNSGPTNPVHTIAFSTSASSEGESPSGLFVTGGKGGELRLWDVADYACLAVHKMPKSGAVLCAFLTRPGSGPGGRGCLVITGWEDGFVRCFDSESLSSQLWMIANAHRGGVKTLSCYMDGAGSGLQYLVTGGGDGSIRVWRLSNRELVTQYSEHKKAVMKVLIDIRSPNIIHSIGADSTVLSYDLRASRRIISHLAASGSMQDMTQRKDNEAELITCDTQSRLLYWDIDYRDPVTAVQDQSRAILRACAISPSGRFLAFVGDDSLLKVLETASGRVIALAQGHSVGGASSVSWTPDERQVVTGGNDACLCIWNFSLGA